MAKTLAITLAVIHHTVAAGSHGDKTKGIPPQKPEIIEIPMNRRVNLETDLFTTWERQGFVRRPRPEENVNFFPIFDIVKGDRQTTGSATGHSAVTASTLDAGMEGEGIDPDSNENMDNGNEGNGDGDAGNGNDSNASGQNAAAGSAAQDKVTAASKVKSAAGNKATAKPTATKKTTTKPEGDEKPVV